MTAKDTYASAAQYLPILKAIRSRYSDEHIGAVCALISMAPARRAAHTAASGFRVPEGPNCRAVL